MVGGPINMVGGINVKGPPELMQKFDTLNLAINSVPCLGYFCP